MVAREQVLYNLQQLPLLHLFTVHVATLSMHAQTTSLHYPQCSINYCLLRLAPQCFAFTSIVVARVYEQTGEHVGIAGLKIANCNRLEEAILLYIVPDVQDCFRLFVYCSRLSADLPIDPYSMVDPD